MAATSSSVASRNLSVTWLSSEKQCGLTTYALLLVCHTARMTGGSSVCENLRDGVPREPWRKLDHLPRCRVLRSRWRRHIHDGMAGLEAIQLEGVFRRPIRGAPDVGHRHRHDLTHCGGALRRGHVRSTGELAEEQQPQPSASGGHGASARGSGCGRHGSLVGRNLRQPLMSGRLGAKSSSGGSGRHPPGRYFGGREPAHLAARSTHSPSCASSTSPVASTKTHAFIGRPVRSNTRVCGSARAPLASSGPRRTIRAPRCTPQHMFPCSMKMIPPNIFLSVTPVRWARWARMRAARFASNAIDPLP